MRVRMVIIVLLAFSCLMLISPVTVAFPRISLGQHVGVDLSPGSRVIEVGMVRPNDPGSGGGGTGVI